MIFLFIFFDGWTILSGKTHVFWGWFAKWLFWSELKWQNVLESCHFECSLNFFIGHNEVMTKPVIVISTFGQLSFRRVPEEKSLCNVADFSPVIPGLEMTRRCIFVIFLIKNYLGKSVMGSRRNDLRGFMPPITIMFPLRLHEAEGWIGLMPPQPTGC